MKNIICYVFLIIVSCMSLNAHASELEIRRSFYKSGLLEHEVPLEFRTSDGIEKEYYESGALKFEAPRIKGSNPRRGLKLCNSVVCLNRFRKHFEK